MYKKNIKTIQLLIVLLSFVFVFISCKKEEKELTKKEILTNGAWHGTTSEEFHDGVLIGSGTYEMEYDFKSNGEGTDTWEGNSHPLKWKFDNDETVLIIDDFGDEIYYFKLETLTQNNLVYSETMTIDDIVYKDIYYFER